MLQIDNTIISFDLLEEKFVCDLISCKGDCCIEGDAGAPLEPEEVSILEEILPVVWSDLTEVSKDVIRRQGVSYIDEDGEPVTSIVNGAECVFTYTDEGGICKCVLEKAFREGRTTFLKPVSCHLYPIRVQKFNEYIALNYHRWKICDCARVNGSKLGVPLYVFLKEPLIRRFGLKWYNQLEIAAEELKNMNR